MEIQIDNLYPRNLMNLRNFFLSSISAIPEDSFLLLENESLSYQEFLGLLNSTFAGIIFKESRASISYIEPYKKRGNLIINEKIY
ncbi:MAG: hypothetical protein ABI721_05390 [Candidatus Dojkabacteria bacterium]